MRQRLPQTELIHSRIEDLDLGRHFALVMVPSNILYTVERLRRAAAHLADGGRLALELTNPHWLRAGAGGGVRVKMMDGNQARLTIRYPLAGDQTYEQEAEIQLVWPDEIEGWLRTAGLRLQRMFGARDAELKSSPSFHVLAGR